MTTQQITRNHNLKIALKIISKKRDKAIFKVDIKNPDFEKPLSQLERNYER